METAQRVRIVWRYSFLTTAFIAIFWTAWYLVVGSVPAVRGFEGMSFSFSPWWDLLLGPIWTAAVIWLITSEDIWEHEDRVFMLTVMLVAGLVFGLIVGPIPLLAVGLSYTLAIILIFTLVVGLYYFFSDKRIKNWFAGK